MDVSIFQGIESLALALGAKVFFVDRLSRVTLKNFLAITKTVVTMPKENASPEAHAGVVSRVESLVLRPTTFYYMYPEYPVRTFC